MTSKNISNAFQNNRKVCKSDATCKLILFVVRNTLLCIKYFPTQ